MKKFFMISALAALSMSLFAADQNTAVVTFSSSYPTGAVNEKAVFSVSATKQVYFSKGNLQYQPSTKTWRFTEHQYDYSGNGGNSYGNLGSGNDNRQISNSSYTGWLDLFGWGCDGFQDPNEPNITYFRPSDASQQQTGYGRWTSGAGIENSNHDWGVYVPISNGGNEVGMWRTLTATEWTYLISNRSGVKHALATVCGVAGLILLPDNWPATWPSGGGTAIEISIPGYPVYYTSYVYNDDQWAVLEANGAVFLPSAGYRNGATYGNGAPMIGYYWLTNSENNSNKKAHCIEITGESIEVAANYRYYGSSVRLVRNK